MDAEQKFLESIQKRKRNDLHVKFFEENGELQYIITPLYTNYTGKKRIIPYRNTHCLKPECVYDEQELVKRFELSGYSTFATFICHTCRKQIQLLKFCYDETLEAILDDVWKHYNKESKLICEKAKIFRNGIWEPILPTYIKNLEENLRRELEGEEQQQRRIPGYEVPANELEEDNRLNQKSAVRKVVVYKNLFKLIDFEQSEYLHLNTQYVRISQPIQNLKSLMFKRYGQSILNSDFISVQNETYFPKHIMAFFLKYLEDWANRVLLNELDSKSNILNKRNPQLNKARFISFFVVKVISYDMFYHLAKYEIWSDNLSSVKQRLSKDQFINQIDKIYIVMHYDERWILTISDPRTKKVKIVDFLDKEMSRIKVDEVDDISRFIIEKEIYPVKVNVQENSPEIKTINFYSDCGYYIASYLYKSIITDRILGEMPFFNVKYGEKNKMRDLLSWLFLKYADADDEDQQIQIKGLEAVRESYIEEESQRIKDKEKEIDNYEDDMIERWGLDRVGSKIDKSQSFQLQQSIDQQRNSPQVTKRDSNYNSFENMLNNLQTKDLTKKKPSFQSMSTINSANRQSIFSGSSGNRQSIFQNQVQNNSIQESYPTQKDSLVRSSSTLKNTQIGDDLESSRLSRYSRQSNKQHRSQLMTPKNNQSSLPPLNKIASEKKIPYFVSTKGELNNILQNWHRNLMEDAKQIQMQQENEELQKKLEKEQKYLDNLNKHGPYNAINYYNQQLDQEDLEKLNELQRKQYVEARINFHRNQLDNYFQQGLDVRQLEQLNTEDLSSLLMQFQKLRMLDNPELQEFDVNDYKNQLLNSMNGLNSDPFSQNVGIDYGQLDPQDIMELAQYNNMLQQSIAQTILQKQMNEQKRSNSKSKKKSRSKSQKKRDK